MKGKGMKPDWARGAVTLETDKRKIFTSPTGAL